MLFNAVFCTWVVIFALDNRAPGAEVDSGPAAPTNQNSELQATNRPVQATDRDVIQQAIEQLRRESESVLRPSAGPPSTTNSVTVADRTDALEERLGGIERTLRLQHQTELEAVQSSNRTILIVAGLLAGAVLMGILCAVLVLTRTINRLCEATSRLSLGEGWGHAPALPALPAGELQTDAVSQVEQVNDWFNGAIERLEKRIREMEQTADPPPLAALESDAPINAPAEGEAKSVGEPIDTEAEPGMGAVTHEQASDRPPAPPDAAEEQASHLPLLLGKGQALLNLGQAEEALRCFDQAAALDSSHAETFVKRGIALEKLQRTEEALMSYNRAISADSSMTLAYLYKGSVCNRLQRFHEALECYEKALRIEPKSVAS